jgi:hypothetical protein
LDAFFRRAACRFGERGMRDAERAGVAAKLGKASEKSGIRRAGKQDRQERIFLGACGIDVIDAGSRRATHAVKVGSKDRAIDAGGCFD